MTNTIENLTVSEKLKRKYEKIYTHVFEDVETASITIAQKIAGLIREKDIQDENCVLGLATGSSPIGVYRELVRMHQEEGLSFKNVITFNLDEYFSLSKDHVQSYFFFMHEHLFKHIDILPENGNIRRKQIVPLPITSTNLEWLNTKPLSYL